MFNSLARNSLVPWKGRWPIALSVTETHTLGIGSKTAVRDSLTASAYNCQSCRIFQLLCVDAFVGRPL